MVNQFQKLQISLNIKYCIFGTHFGTLLGHIICTKGLLIGLAKIKSIMDMKYLMFVRQLHPTLEHIGYYMKFISDNVKLSRRWNNYQWKTPNTIGHRKAIKCSIPTRRNQLHVNTCLSIFEINTSCACRCIIHSTRFKSCATMA